MSAALISGCDCGGAGAVDAGDASVLVDAPETEDAPLMGDGATDAFVAPTPACRRDMARIAAAGDCLSHDDCPCGTSCELGECLSQCMADADCDTGERCDDFGRCRDADHTAIVSPPEPTGTAAALDAEAVATIAVGHDDTLVRFVVRGADSRVRVTGRYGAELECAPGMPFTTECDLDVVMAGTHVALRARRSVSLPEDDVPAVHVYSDAGEATITLLRADQRPGSALLSPSGGGGPEPQPIAGVYAGFARLDSHGANPDAEGLPALVDFPITAEIWGSAPGMVTFRIDDPYHALSSDGVVVGSSILTATDDILTGAVNVPVQPYATGTLAPGDTWSLLAAWLLSEMRTTTLGGEVVIGVHTELRGTGIRPWVDWNLTLHRTGEASGASTPAAEAPATLTYSETSRLASPTVWENAVATRFPAYSSLSGDGKMERYQFLFGETALDACAGLDGSNDARRAFYGMSHGGSDWRTERGLAFELMSLVDEVGVGADVGQLTLPFDGSVSMGTSASHSVICAGSASVDLSQPPGSFFISGVAGFDHCAELSAATGCTVSRGPEIVSVVDLPVTGTVRETPTNPFRPLVAGETVRIRITNPAGGALQVCTMPALPPFCAELASCVEPPTGTTRASVLASTFGAATLPTGDVHCASGSRSASIDLDTLAAAAPVPTLQSVEDCVTELARLRTAPAPTGTYGDGLRSVFSSSRCVDAVRLLTAIGFGMDAGSSTRAGEGAEAYGSRLLVRWLDLHANIAHEAEQRNALYDLVQATPGAPAVIDPQAALDASLGAWDLLLQPTFGRRLDQLTSNVLAEPDYRLGRAGVTIRPSDEQANGLPVSIVSLASRQVRLLRSVLEDEWLEGGTPPPRSRLHAILPRVIAARALAAGLAGRAGVAYGMSDTVSWGGDYRLAEATLSEDLRALIAFLERAASGANPLGIEDDDLPLYFLDDTTGPGGRFAAVSDFLIGTGPGSTAWVPSLVASTEAAESAARAAWIDEIDRATRSAQTSVEHTRWVSELRAEYEDQLRAYCGTTRSGLVDDPAFNALTCALDDDPECQEDPDEDFASWTVDDFLGRMCVASEYAADYIQSRGGLERERWGDRVSHPIERRRAPSPPYGQALQFFAIDCYRGADTRVSIGTCADGSACLVCDSGVIDPGLEGASTTLPLEAATLAYLGRLDSAHYAHLQSCQGLFPEMREIVPVHESRFEVPGCAHGAIGEAFSAVAQADDDLELARAEAAQHMEAYDIAMRSCLILEEANAAVAQANEAHVANMTDMIRSRADMESSAAILGAVADCLATMAGVAGTVEGSKDSAIADGIAIGLGVGSCVAGGLAGGLEASAAQLQGDIEVAEVEHDALVSGLEAAAETDICFNDARLELVGSRAATLRIRTAAATRARAVARLSDLLAEVERLHDEGHDYVTEVEAMRVTPASGEAWANGSIQSFVSRFRLARRATYLAVRAVEHELQTSLMARQAVLAADTASDLEDVLATLWTTAGTRSIGGSRPSDLHTVLSLRDDILQLADETSAPEGLHGLSRIDRLRVMLSDERYAVRGETGRLVGLQIPFTLAPLGALGFPTGGVPIYSTTDCAERVWSVNASILGNDVWTGSDTTFTRIDLLKQNTFFSQWCGAPPPDAPFQVSSVRPSNNLFLEPGVSGGIDGPFGTGETELFSRARMQAFFNVSRADLENPMYANGETSELAARGLYGQYAVFIPADLISRETTSGGRTDGLVLDRIDDILLRLDYVSVAR